MSSEGSGASRALEVSKVVSRLFGTAIGPDGVIDESLRRATDDRLARADVVPKLANALERDLPERLTDAELVTHPLAVWVELVLGLEDGQILKRRRPITFVEATKLLAQDSGIDPKRCGEVLENFLTRVSLPDKDRGGSGEHAFMAFKRRCCTARSKSLTSLCRLQSHPAQYVSGIPSAAILLSISHPIRCSTRCLANVRARISGPMIAL